ncbi:hypothetical protein CLCR_10575 [Cladophialophora carrionii]|uniref:Uncharacterized protein n=1 Tax=Cladophialophora carrionii TaxID=86049 RepID=A0A1C1CV79_9EURO|nr:hypothetical protein CLCR_10575 [Cladophialophora carrionii]
MPKRMDMRSQDLMDRNNVAVDRCHEGLNGEKIWTKRFCARRNGRCPVSLLAEFLLLTTPGGTGWCQGGVVRSSSVHFNLTRNTATRSRDGGEVTSFPPLTSTRLFNSKFKMATAPYHMVYPMVNMTVNGTTPRAFSPMLSTFLLAAPATAPTAVASTTSWVASATSQIGHLHLKQPDLFIHLSDRSRDHGAKSRDKRGVTTITFNRTPGVSAGQYSGRDATVTSGSSQLFSCEFTALFLSPSDIFVSEFGKASIASTRIIIDNPVC